MRVDDCPADRALDAAVARVIYKNFDNLVVDLKDGMIASSEEAIKERYWGWEVEGGTLKKFCMTLPRYSKDIDEVWGLVRNLKILIIPLIDGRWLATPHNAIPFSRTKYTIDLTDGEVAETAPLAVTRAFLKANGIECIDVD